MQPERFDKGDGAGLVRTREALNMRDFALDGGKEPEVAAIYLIV